MDILTYALAKKYVTQSLDGLGAVKGANCTIKSTTQKDDGTEIVFEWTGISGTKETTTILVKNGEQGNGVAKVEKIKTVDLVDTYRMTFDDGNTFDYEVTNGSSGSGGGKIDIVKVNGVELPVVDKAVDIEIPEYIYIGNTEPTDENVVLWVNPDEASGNPEVAISKAEGNALEQKQDGLYVAEGAIKISKEESNIIEQKSDGIFATINSQDEKTVNTILDIVKDNIETEDLNFSVFFN